MRAVVRLAHITVITSAPCTSVRHRAWSVGGRSGSAREGGAEVDFDPRANPSPTSRSQFHPSAQRNAATRRKLDIKPVRVKLRVCLNHMQVARNMAVVQ